MPSGNIVCRPAGAHPARGSRVRSLETCDTRAECGWGVCLESMRDETRSSNHTTTQVSACPSPPPVVIMSVSALLKLSQWCQRRLNDQSGEVVCSSPTPLPPAYAPQQGSSQEVSGGSTASALGDAPGGEST